ncbi:MAG: DUF1579 family protein [Anaerolineales bacterium]|nr:DUF1579 family protein [Anaerolineales bacterium]
MIPEAFLTLAGSWQGTNHLWLDPTQPARESVGTAVLQPIAQQKFLSLHYTWADDGQPQDGQLMVGQDGPQMQATWVDSWHMQDKMMILTGATQPDGSLSVTGSYAAPPGPDWGWRITLQPESQNRFTFRMHNITPEGEEMLAVEVKFSRAH